jgi:dodecin
MIVLRSRAKWSQGSARAAGFQIPPNTHVIKEVVMTESVYKIIEVIGTSPNSWEEAARNAVDTAGKTLRDLRIAEISKLDMKVEEGKVVAYRARVQLSFKYNVD